MSDWGDFALLLLGAAGATVIVAAVMIELIGRAYHRGQGDLADDLRDLAGLHSGVGDVPNWHNRRGHPGVGNRRLDGSHPAVRRERGAATLLGPAIVVGLVLLASTLGWLALVAVGSLGVAVFAADQLREAS